MAQLDNAIVVAPFGEVNIFQEPGGPRVRATILVPPQVEGAQTGLAIDGSNSMLSLFGAGVPKLFRTADSNVVQPVARMMAEYLANFDSDGNTSVIYWACGLGDSLEELGDMNAAQSRRFEFNEPKSPGKGTRLLPAIRYFAEQRFPTAPWGIYVFITDGVIEDMEAVKAYSLAMGRQLANGSRNFLKFVLIGLGSNIDEDQMSQLDDLDYGGLQLPNGDDVDLWDHTTAGEMKSLDEIFKECVSKNTIVSPSAQIVDSSNRPVRSIDGRNYADGLPALVEFTLSPGSTSFTLSLPNGQSFNQPLQ
jgi:hypothetical protein